jgi:hypothetical protein
VQFDIWRKSVWSKISTLNLNLGFQLSAVSDTVPVRRTRNHNVPDSY